LGAINYLSISTSKIDLFSYLLQNKKLIQFLQMIIGIVGLYYLFNRDYYLPFLGETVMPIKKGEDVLDKKVLVKVELTSLPPNRKIIYWASNENVNTFTNPYEAYKNYQNSGISESDNKGDVTLMITCPGSYKVGRSKVLNPHLHYRYELENGLLSRVFTKYVKC
jgi:hypothetical protein